MSKKKNTENKVSENKIAESKDNEIESLKDDVASYKSLAQRAQADLVNFRKRIEGEQLDIRVRVKEQVILKFLEVVDQLDVALNNKTLDQSWINGIDAIHKNFINTIFRRVHKI